MGLVASKLSRFVIGLAASGGLALAFAGSASAASPALTTSPTVTNNDQTDTHSSTANVVSTTVTSTTKTVGTVIGSVDPTSGSGTGTGSGPTANSEPGLSPVITSDVATTSTNSNQTPVVPATTTPTDPDGATVTTPVVQTTDAVVTARPVLSYSAIHPIVFSTVTMPQTPIDLSAATNPAPAPNKQPSAPKSSGALTALTAELAGVVVPELFHPLTLAIAALPHLLSLGSLTIVAILLSLLTLTFGQTLRRGGYATAARSDVASLTFATPHLMDYGQLRFAIVFFGGVRDQNKTYLMNPNAYQERR